MTAFAVDNGYESERAAGGKGRACGKRRGWSGLEIVALVLGFVVFWPIGLAILAYLLCRGHAERREDRERFKGFVSNMRSNGWGGGPSNWGSSGGGWRDRPRSTGNLAFDQYRQAELDRLEEERRRLIEEEREFAEFLEHLKLAKDREEFDRFMRDRAKRADDDTRDDLSRES